MKNILEFRVLKKDKLLNFLYSNVNKSKNNIKTLLKNGCVYVNEKKVTKFDFDLNVNDDIVIKMFNTKLDILYEDKNLIIVNKKDKLLTVSNNNISENTLYKEVSSYVKKTNKNNKIKEKLQSEWNNIVNIREYVAIVHGITDKEGIIKSYLKENDNHIVYSSSSGKYSVTRYKRLKNNNKYSKILIYLDTGRKNQIRVHMKDIHHPVLGDRKYGIKDNVNRLLLHHSRIVFKNPVDSKLIDIKCDSDDEFDKYV